MTKAKTVIEIPDYITVRDLAALMSISPINIIKELMKNGIMANINQQIDFDTAALVAQEMGFDAISNAPQLDETAEADLSNLPAWRTVIAQERSKDLKRRPPVVTILGHVDHGKTSLLDAIRKANVQSGEAGGITQHIGAYQIKHNAHIITFLDTPGHAAFTAMRARGAQATDIAILVVAADDGLMPQTREAIDHARAAKVPIIVAVNKIDLPSANLSRVMQQLSEIGLTPDAWGGDTLVIPVSARQKRGIDDLLEAISLVADDIEPKANPVADKVTGVVIEARMERGRGITATVLVQNGTLSVGDTVLLGRDFGKIKSMVDYNGKAVKKAPPSMPVSISSLSGMPSAGERFYTVESDKIARQIVEDMAIAPEEDRVGPSLEDFFARMQSGQTKTLTLIVKADVQGSLEPIVSTLGKINVGSEVELEILRSATGMITATDVMLASASGAVIIGFNVSADSAAERTAAAEGVEIKTYNVIYHLFEDVEKSLKGMLEPVYEQRLIGKAEIRQVFHIKNVGSVAGCYMRTGMAKRRTIARVFRDGRTVFEGSVTSLKHHQESVKEIKQGFEFGVGLQNWDKFRERDIIEFYEKIRVDRP